MCAIVAQQFPAYPRRGFHFEHGPSKWSAKRVRPQSRGPRKGQRIPSRGSVSFQRNRASVARNERQRNGPDLGWQARTRSRARPNRIRGRTRSRLELCKTRGLCAARGAHPRATRHIDNTRMRAGDTRGAERGPRETLGPWRIRGTRGGREKREKNQRGKYTYTYTGESGVGAAERKLEKSGWLPVPGRETGCTEGLKRVGEDPLPCPSSTNDRHPPHLSFILPPLTRPCTLSPP